MYIVVFQSPSLHPVTELTFLICLFSLLASPAPLRSPQETDRNSPEVSQLPQEMEDAHPLLVYSLCVGLPIQPFNVEVSGCQLLHHSGILSYDRHGTCSHHLRLDIHHLSGLFHIQKQRISLLQKNDPPVLCTPLVPNISNHYKNQYFWRCHEPDFYV